MIGGLRGHRGLALAAAVTALAGLLAYLILAPGRSSSGDAAGGRGAEFPASTMASGVHRGPAGISGGSDGPAKSPKRPIPERLPDFSLATVDGRPRTLSSFTQPSLVVNFWATWCAPCRREIPLLKKLRAERGAKGVEVVGIAVDFRDDVLQYAREIGIDYPLLIGEQDGLEAAQAFGMDLVLPFTAFADAQRRIVALKVGELHADEAAFILDIVEEVNAGRLVLPQARTAIAQKLRILAAGRVEKR